jgi:hypothetical protein
MDETPLCRRRRANPQPHERRNGPGAAFRNPATDAGEAPEFRHFDPLHNRFVALLVRNVAKQCTPLRPRRTLAPRAPAQAGRSENPIQQA